MPTKESCLFIAAALAAFTAAPPSARAQGGFEIRGPASLPGPAAARDPDTPPPAAPAPFAPGSAVGAGALALSSAALSLPCACGCGVFEVGTSSMLPRAAGGTAWLEVDFQDQNRNWSGASSAPAADNSDKDLRTTFITAGVQYMFNRSWGVEAEVPFDIRHFRAADEDGTVASTDWSGLGDIRLRGLYTGFTDDLSAGVTFGFKLPTGRFQRGDDLVDIDRDTQIGTGSTDILLGGFYRHDLWLGSNWTWFVQANADLPVLIQDHYRPGLEFDQAIGLYYGGFIIHGVVIAPIAQVIAAERTSDRGTNSAHPVASGYERVFLSPGVEVNLHPLMLYADVEVPVYQHMTGNQLIAPILFKGIVSYSF